MNQKKEYYFLLFGDQRSTKVAPNNMLKTNKILLILISLCLLACGEEESTSASQTTQKTEAKPVNVRPVDQLVQAIQVSRTKMHDATEAQKATIPGEHAIALENSGSFKRPLTLVYEKLNNAPFFMKDGEVPEGAWEALSEFLRDIPSHALNINDYQLSQLQQAHTNYAVADGERSDEAQKIEELSASLDGLKKLAAMLESDALPMNLEGELQRAGLSNGNLKEVESLLSLIEAKHKASLSMATASISLDARMLRNVMQVLLDFRFIKRAHPFEPTRYPRKATNSYARQMAQLLVPNSPESEEETPSKLKLPALPENVDARENLEEFLAAQIPPFPLYEPLRIAHENYRTLAEKEAENPPPKISRRAVKLKKGRSSVHAVKLKKRLAFEGYFPEMEEYTDKFDDELKEAILNYQKTHQLTESGDITKGTVYSLNKSLAKRLDQIGLGLQRYRESDINWERPERYVRVNVAAFWAQVWDSGELKRQHKVVVGNNGLVKKFKDGVAGHLNRTRLFNAEITSIVVNPYWRVPKRIKTLELDEELIDNPDFYEQNKYEVDTSSTGVEIVRQTPGDHNALGRVKINFPNPHAIYMHDTPSKSTFKHAVRSQSHGCMRLQDPLEMAQFILESDNAYDDAKFNETLESMKERTISLNTPLRIFVEYNVTSVSDDGKPMFLSDIYKYDRAYFDRDLPVVERFKLAEFREGKKIPFEKVVKVQH